MPALCLGALVGRAHLLRALWMGLGSNDSAQPEEGRVRSQRSLYWFAVAFACFYVNAAILAVRLGVI